MWRPMVLVLEDYPSCIAMPVHTATYAGDFNGTHSFSSRPRRRDSPLGFERKVALA